MTGADVAGGARSAPGTIVVLNGTPRSGKSRIAAALQESSDSLWLTFGVDAMAEVIPPGLRPGNWIGGDFSFPVMISSGLTCAKKGELRV